MNNLWIGIAIGIAAACIVCALLIRVRILTPLTRLRELLKGLNEMEHNGFTSSVIRGIKAGAK